MGRLFTLVRGCWAVIFLSFPVVQDSFPLVSFGLLLKPGLYHSGFALSLFPRVGPSPDSFLISVGLFQSLFLAIEFSPIYVS